MRYPPNIIEQIKARLNIVEEVRKVVPNLKKRGKYWWANCPFHSEKSPSFHVREEGNYYCFGCGAAGDVINFVQETQGGTFTDTIERLAQQTGVKLPEPENVDPHAREKRQDGFKALERATVFYQRCLNGSPGGDYIARRGLSQTTIDEFQLGYAPDGWTNLKDALSSEGFKPEVLRDAGLTSESSKGKGDYDRFRHRVMFPIHDTQNRVVGFGGRVLMAEEGPKYLNSPETPFFSKSYLLYNLGRARQHLKQTNQLVLVEGYMDVITLWQAGFRTAVAPLGTSVTEEQFGILWQNHPHPIVCLDGDAAGKNAAIRAAQKVLPVLEPGHTLQFVWLPQGEDPDSLIQKDGLATFRQLLAQPTPLETVIWQFLTADADLTKADDRAAVEGKMAGLLATIKNAIVKRTYGQVLKDKMYQATRHTNANAGGGGGGPQKLKIREDKAPADYRPSVQGDAGARYLLALVCRWPEMIPDVVESLAQLTFPPGPAADLAHHILRAHAVQRLGPEQFKADFESGPHADTVRDLTRSTGVDSLVDLATSPMAEFNRAFAEWYHARNQRDARKEALKTTDWSKPEQWSRFKALNEDPEATSDSRSDPDLTSGRDQPM